MIGIDQEVADASPISTAARDVDAEPPAASQHHTLRHRLLGPSLTKSGQDGVDQKKVSEIIYEASKGSHFFKNEEAKDKNLSVKIDRTLAKKRELERIEAQGGLQRERRRADEHIEALEYGRCLSQIIIHIDCDAFYAAVEELDQPHLRDKPFAVGKGVLTTCNYVARRFGCRSGMSGFIADKLCPGLIHVPLNFEKYTRKAHEVRAVLEKYDSNFESASIDEAYLNITKYCDEHHMEPEDAVTQLRDEVFQMAKITVSAGIACNKRLAKVCSDRNKPNGQYRLPSDRASIMSFMSELPTRKVNGIGRVWERELDAIGIKVCGDIYEQRHFLSRLFGEKAFEFLMMVYLGLGATEIRPAEDHERKSVGTESTFHDMSDPHELRAQLRRRAEELEQDLRRTEFKGRTLVLKIKLHTYEVLTRQVAPPKAVFTADELYHFSLPMLQKLEKEIPGMKLRLMGLRCTHLVSMKKGDIDFFGRTRQLHAGKLTCESADSVDEDGWQKWPDAEFEDAARQEREEEMQELERLSQEYTEGGSSAVQQCVEDVVAVDYDRHANGFAWRSILEKEALKSTKDSCPPSLPERWSCPVCSVAQAADERAFNEHIDGCLSKQTIKEIVREKPPDQVTLSSTHGSATKRKRGGTGQQRTLLEKKAKKAFFT